MKSGNYEDLINKFYAGNVTAEEILLLKKEGLIDENDAHYASAIEEERTQQMDWTFEEFMKEVPKAKVVAITPFSNWLKTLIAAAAVLLAIFAVFVLMPKPTEHPSREMVRLPQNNNVADSNQQLLANNIMPVNEIKDTASVSEKLNSKSTNNKTLVKNSKKLTPKKSVVSSVIKKEERKAALEDYLVMVNGKPITDEATAIAITRESLGMVSANLTSTMDEMKPIAQIKIKLK